MAGSGSGTSRIDPASDLIFLFSAEHGLQNLCGVFHGSRHPAHEPDAGHMESPEGCNTFFIGKFILKTEFRIPDVYEIVVTYCTDGVIEVVCTILAFDNVFYEIEITIGVS